MSDDEHREVIDGEVKRGRGRPQKPVIPLPPWPTITGPLEMDVRAFKRGGEVTDLEIGRAPPKPATFIYGRR